MSASGFALPAHELMQTRASLGKVCVERENLLVQRGWFAAANGPTCREWPRPATNRPLVNRPRLAEVPLTGLSFFITPK